MVRPGSHDCKNFASALQRPLPLQLKILQRGHTHFFIEAPPASCSKFGKLSMACILLFCLSLFFFCLSFFFFSLLLSLLHAHGSFSPPPPPLSFSLSLTLSLSLSSSLSSSLSLSLSLSLSPHYIMFCSQPHTGSHGISSQSHRRVSSPTKKKINISSTNRKRLRREYSLFQNKRKEKKRTTETAWPRIPSHIANTAAASAFFLQLQHEKLLLRTSTLKSYCLSSPTK